MRIDIDSHKIVVAEVSSEIGEAALRVVAAWKDYNEKFLESDEAYQYEQAIIQPFAEKFGSVNFPEDFFCGYMPMSYSDGVLIYEATDKVCADMFPFETQTFEV